MMDLSTLYKLNRGAILVFYVSCAIGVAAALSASSYIEAIWAALAALNMRHAVHFERVAYPERFK
jgi:hypothetical protein